MFPFLRKQPYQSVPTTESESKLQSEPKPPLISRGRPRTRFGKMLGFWVALSLGVLGVFFLGRSTGYYEADVLHTHLQEQSCRMNEGETPAAPAPTLVPQKECTNPDFRQEWRTLSKDEKMNYIDAVNCLARTPSVLRDNSTLYDDFPWVHNRVAHTTHGTAAFLSWHRRFIAIYERYLQDKCGYRGALPYWDWTLDWEDLPNSPIFSEKTGFGGNGDPKSPVIVGGGHCVIDGPFSHLKPQYHGSHERPHCLSRGFSDFPGRNASPVVVENVLSSEDYETFFLATENGPHNVAPLGINGDFASFTAPNDPIFYLHHAQIDRLWFLWQMRRPKVRLGEYKGRAQSNALASLDDILSMEGLAKNVTVSEVVNMQDNELCYRYSLS